jgi:ferredoxin
MRADPSSDDGADGGDSDGVRTEGGTTDESAPGCGGRRWNVRRSGPRRRCGAWVGFHRLNPLPHAGTISVFLLGVVIATGVYITLFFSFGVEASYRSVEKMTDHPIQGVVRTVHRYASAALVLTTLVHAWRIFVAGPLPRPAALALDDGCRPRSSLVWLAGVTGYWLVWDRRAQAITEASTGCSTCRARCVRHVLRPRRLRGGRRLRLGDLVRDLGSCTSLLTVVIAFAIWRHVRRTKLRWLPPRHWMLIMLGALVVASIAFPADLLERAEAGQVIGDLPLDPFVLFLLPPILGGWAWVTVLVMLVAIAAALVVPHLLTSSTPVVRIDDDACTGCELCVVDCPYHALVMRERSDADDEAGTQARRPIAVVDADRCVGCGICVGACSFGAMALPGFTAPEQIEPAGKHVVIACSRHLNASPTSLRDDPALTVVEVPCAGMMHARPSARSMQAGATGVQVVGCAPGDCAYGIGNRLIAERLVGRRGRRTCPRSGRAGTVQTDFVAPGEPRRRGRRTERSLPMPTPTSSPQGRRRDRSGRGGRHVGRRRRPRDTSAVRRARRRDRPRCA